MSDAPRSTISDYVMWLVENGAFALGMALMFSRTSELAMAFAPNTILGFTGLEVYYGIAVGMLVEGALFVMKLMLHRAQNLLDWLWNVLIVVAPFTISAVAQVFDSFQVRNTMAQQPAFIQTAVTWGVPSIPSLIIFLFVSKAVFSSVPPEIMPNWMKRVNAVAGGQPVSAPRLAPGFVGRFIGRRRPNPTKAASPMITSIEETSQPTTPKIEMP